MSKSLILNDFEKKVQKSFEEQLKENINKGKAKVEKKLQRNILDTII